ncbi:DUF4276 family protein [Desulfallas thermosapovorans]|uniref:Uncharacterized protein DUF4276 n=1 Tax=Desulfallas thermosapovorans DSM 6562 TaxID=1121431 RepID=A0A5S4ZML9_9FIRM|nr:DUF4276 family protein [Desulfallas thermosapovorans]TYO92289.1 uncharacterized protein DUF4276 [Desulfallas thermosapovorans DSM 6562]
MDIIRLNVVVEGQTEETFVSEVLAPHLAMKGVFAVARAVATSRTKTYVYRGGVTTYAKIRNDIINWIKQDPSSYITTMFDLYGLPKDFPGKDSLLPNINCYDKVSILEKAFAQDINYQRFIPYLQLHEFETLLFAELDKLKFYYVQGKDAAIRRLKDTVKGIAPELINDGVNTAPSKSIIKEIPEYKDGKRVVGPLIVGQIGLPALKQACPHFNEWIKEIEFLSQR